MPDYYGALAWLQRQVEQTSRLDEFLRHRVPLEESLRWEERYGTSTDRVRQRALEFLPPLDRLALEVAGVSFTDIAFCRFPDSRLPSTRLHKIAADFNAGALPFSAPPPVQPLLQELPFGQLTPEQFEAVCFALVAAQPDALDVEFRGVGGNRQDGIDILARHRLGEGSETWAYQCKRYRTEFTNGLLKEALEKLAYPADYHVLMLSRNATAGVQDVVAKRPNTFLWDARVLSRKLKNYPDLVEEFFGRTWRQAFAVQR